MYPWGEFVGQSLCVSDLKVYILSIDIDSRGWLDYSTSGVNINNTCSCHFQDVTKIAALHSHTDRPACMTR